MTFTAEKLHDIRIEGGPATSDIHVSVDGHDISGAVQSLTYTADVKTGIAEVHVKLVGKLDAELLAKFVVAKEA